jgi:hypothetical protein
LKLPSTKNGKKTKDEYKSPTFVYCREIDAMVPLVRVGVQIPLRIQGSWNDNNAETPKVVLESSKGIDGKLGPNVKGSPEYYHIRSH